MNRVGANFSFSMMLIRARPNTSLAPPTPECVMIETVCAGTNSAADAPPAYTARLQRRAVACVAKRMGDTLHKYIVCYCRNYLPLLRVMSTDCVSSQTR